MLTRLKLPNMNRNSFYIIIIIFFWCYPVLFHSGEYSMLPACIAGPFFFTRNPRKTENTEFFLEKNNCYGHMRSENILDDHPSFIVFASKACECTCYPAKPASASQGFISGDSIFYGHSLPAP